MKTGSPSDVSRFGEALLRMECARPAARRFTLPLSTPYDALRTWPSRSASYAVGRDSSFQAVGIQGTVQADARTQEGNPMQSIPTGARGSFTIVVTPDHLANRFKDAMLPPVLATPVMIMIMENAALNAVKPYLDAGESAVGTRVDVVHLAATPVGRRVTGQAEVTRVD